MVKAEQQKTVSATVRKRNAEQVIGESISGARSSRSVGIPCIPFSQNGRKLYTGAIAAEDLAILYDTEVAKIDIWGPNNPNGYQRALSSTRARRFGRYLANEGIAPTSIVIYQRDPGNGIEFDGEQLIVPLPEEGERAAEPLLYIVDGQHRTYGISEMYKEGWTVGETKIYIPVTIMVGDADSGGDPKLEEANQFLTINTKQKRVRTDLAHQIILKAEGMSHGMITKDTRIPGGLTREEQVPYATFVANLLAEDEKSPWFDRIVRPNIQRNVTGLPSQGQFEDGLLDNYLGVGSIISWAGGSGLTTKQLYSILSAYWEAIFDLCSGPLENPEEYVLTKTAGIHALHGILPALFMARRNLPLKPDKDDFKVILKTMGNVFTDEYWSTTADEAASFGTGKKSFKELAKTIFETLS